VVTFCLIPYNDKKPVISPAYSQADFTEGSRRTGPIFATIEISDDDEECTNNTLQYAIAIIDTFTSTMENESIMVSLFELLEIVFQCILYRPYHVMMT